MSTLPAVGVPQPDAPAGRRKPFFWHDKVNRVVYIYGGTLSKSGVDSNRT